VIGNDLGDGIALKTSDRRIELTRDMAPGARGGGCMIMPWDEARVGRSTNRRDWRRIVLVFGS